MKIVTSMLGGAVVDSVVKDLVLMLVMIHVVGILAVLQCSKTLKISLMLTGKIPITLDSMLKMEIVVR